MLKNKFYGCGYRRSGNGFYLEPEGDAAGGNVDTDSSDFGDDSSDTTQSADAVSASDLPEVSGEKIPIVTKKTEQPKPDLTSKEKIGALDDMDDSAIEKSEAFKKEPVVVKKIEPSEEDADETPEEEKKVEPVVDDKTKAQSDPKDKKGRTADDFPEKYRDLIKKNKNHLPNDLWNTLKSDLPKLVSLEKERDELKVKYEDASKGIVRMPESWAEHPDAYVLTPDYRKFTRGVRQAREEEAHWMQQLERIEKGESWVNLTGRDENGNLTGTEITQVDQIAHKIAVEKAMRKASSFEEQFQGKIVSLKENHVSGYQQACKAVTDTCKEYFPWQKDEKLLAQELVGLDGKSASIKDHIEDYKKILDPRFRNHPLAEANANMYIALVKASQQIVALSSQTKVQAVIKKDIEDTEPSNKGKAGGGSAKIKKDLVPDTSDMDA